MSDSHDASRPPPAAADSPPGVDEVARVIMLLNGRMDHGGPFWCYVAIKPSQFAAFRAAEAAAAIDLYAFDDFGEVIVSAEGDVPPYAVTAEVARMYGTDPRSFFRDIDPMAEIGKKMRSMGYDADAEPPPDPDPPTGNSSWVSRFGKRK